MAMTCPSCGFHNPPGMRFCGNCGTRLGAAPASSPPPTPAELLSLPERMGVLVGADLLERFRQAGLEAAGQRRNVTVLFADLSGFTALSERMDSEDLYELIQRFIHLLVDNVYKYEGIVDKLTGDGIMALFGAPITYENNAERAVRAALDMRADVMRMSREMSGQLGVELQIHAGLHSGAVVVGGIGSNLIMDYTAIGDTVNLAHRIEEAAPPGTILVSKGVYRQTRALFDYQPVSVLNPKGISHPVIAYGVLRLKKEPGVVRGIEGMRAPMIGRDHELNQLQERVENLVNSGHGQLVFVTGEAGMGKSRLTAEFKQRLVQYPLRVLEGQSLAYRRSMSYWIFTDIFYSYLNVTAATPPGQVSERLAKNTITAMGSQAVDALPYLEHMLSLPCSDERAAERLRYQDASQLRQGIFLAVRDLLLAEAGRQPLLLILEDLHWADDASLELLSFLKDSLRQVSIFLLCISRGILPGSMARMVEWSRANLGDCMSMIQLEHLSLDQSELLLSNLVTISFLPAALRDQILQRSGGIPFYLEEILRMLIDAGALRYVKNSWEISPDLDIVGMGVPDTLQGLILARFDRLDVAQRHALQVAAVIGNNFSIPVLNEVLTWDEAELYSTLNTLTEREFIQPRSSEIEAEYSFRHILMSDAIYGTLLRRDRSKIHGLVGAAIEKLYAGRLEGQVEILANHYRWSSQPEKGLHYLVLAGQKAARNHVNAQARQHFESALELCANTDSSLAQKVDIAMGLGDALVFAGEYPAARQQFASGLEAILDGGQGGFDENRCAFLRKIAKTHERQGEYDQAMDFLAQAQAALQASPQSLPTEEAEVLSDIGWIHFRRGSFTEAHHLLQEALGLVEASEAYGILASIYNRLGGVAYNQGDLDRAAGFLRKSIALRESIYDRVGLSSSFINLGILELEMGEFDNALESLTRSYELKSRLGQMEGIAMALNNLGWLRMQRGELQEARQVFDHALEVAQQIGYHALHKQILKNIGELHLEAEDWELAHTALAPLIADLAETSARDQLLDTYRLLGEAALGAGDLHQALDWCTQAVQLLNQMDEVKDLTLAQRGELRRFRGMVAINQGDWEAARKFLSESSEIFQKLRSRLYQGRVMYQFGRLAAAQGDRQKARLRYREASLLFQSIGAKLQASRAVGSIENL